jgi:FAD:protein FMN transferase
VSRFVEHVMGMPISLALRGRHATDDRGASAWAAVLKVLRDADRVFSTCGDIACRTLDPQFPPWRIGVEDPRDPARLVAVVPIRTGAVATSGTARRGAHIVDARTGVPATGIASVTVVGDDLTAVDIDATAACALGPAAAADWLRGRSHRSALIVHADGRSAVLGRR